MNATTTALQASAEAEKRITVADGLRKFAQDTAEHLIVRRQAGADSSTYYTAARDVLKHAMKYADAIDPRITE